MLYGFDKKRVQPASHVEAVLDNSKLQLAGVCDSDKVARKIFQRKYGSNVNFYKNHKELIRDLNSEKINCDIMVISTPDSTHYDVLKYVLTRLKTKKRLIIFCEKPIALDSRSALKIKHLVKNPKLNVVINHSRRWSTIWKEVYKLSKKIGVIEKSSFYFSTSPENKNIVQIRDGIHIADLIGWFNIQGKTSVNRIKLPYFIYDFHLWGNKGKIEVLNWGQTLRFFKVIRSSHFQGFKELKLKLQLSHDESLLKNTYNEFVEFLSSKKNSLSTNLQEGIDAVSIFEKYVYDPKLSINTK